MRLRDLRLLRDDAHDEDAIMAFAREHGLGIYDAACLGPPCAAAIPWRPSTGTWRAPRLPREFVLIH